MRYKLALLLLLAPAVGLRAQTYDLSHHTELLGDLSDVQWRFHTGDDPRWADPSFDDSAWPLLRADRGWAEQGYAGYHGFAWYRLHVHLPRPGLAIALSPAHIDNAYRIYFDGVLLGGVGELGPHAPLLHRPYDFYRARASGTEAVIAVRVWSFAWGAPYGVGGFHRPNDMRYGFASPSGFLIGSPNLVERLNRYRMLLITEQDTADISVSALAICAGLVFIFLWWRQRSSREYLCLGISLVAAPWGPSLFYGLFPHSALNVAVLAAVFDLSGMVLYLFAFVFIYAFLRIPLTRLTRWALWIGAALFFVSLSSPVLQNLGRDWVSPAASQIAGLIGLLVFYFWTFLPLLRNWKMRDARLITVPWVLRCSAGICDIALAITFTAGWQHRWPRMPNLINSPFPVNLGQVGLFLFLPIVGLILLDRFVHVSDHDAHQRSELEAAREVQRRIVPVSLPALPGWQMEAAYLPAQEVGGDFYQVLERTDGSLLVVVGDVSGKGLKAAMTGTLAIGALRTLASEDLGPGGLLTRLNREMVRGEDGGFVTCLCARISAEDGMTVANAGHIPPYCNGEELNLPPGLPLGIFPDAEYSESVFALQPGETITLLSDGVAEARNASGELFGFERTREISGQAAGKIAAAAQAFGQEDDITVLTLTFAPAPLPAG